MGSVKDIRISGGPGSYSQRVWAETAIADLGPPVCFGFRLVAELFEWNGGHDPGVDLKAIFAAPTALKSRPDIKK